MAQTIFNAIYRQVFRAGDTLDNNMRLRQGYAGESPNYVSTDNGSVYFASFFGFDTAAVVAALSSQVITDIQLRFVTDSYGANNNVMFHLYKSPFVWDPNDGSRLNPSDYYPARRLKDLTPFETPEFTRNQDRTFTLPSDFLDHILAGYLMGIWRRASTNRPTDTLHARAISADAEIQLIVTHHAPVSDFSLNKATVDAGQPITVTVVPNDSVYNHDVTFTIGSYSQTMNIPAGTTAKAFTIPMTWLNAIPNSTSGLVNVKVTTKSGTTVMGSKSKTFTMTCPTSIVPTYTSLTTELVDGVWGLYLQTKSKSRVRINGATGAYGSYITSTKITGGGLNSGTADATTPVLGTAGAITFTGTVTDSRGRTYTRQAFINVTAYKAPAISALSGTRTDASGTPADLGTNAKIKPVYSFSSVSGNNSLTMTLAYRVNDASVWVTITNNLLPSGQDYVITGDRFALDKAYQIQITITDSLGAKVSRILPLATAMYVMDYRPGGHGVGVGQVADTEYAFKVHPEWDFYIKGQLIERMMSNPEILLNTDFRVWQRGRSAFTVAAKFTADMWRTTANAGGLVFSVAPKSADGGIVIENDTTSAASMSLRQYVEDTSIIGKTVTLTVDADGFSPDPVTFVFQAAETTVLSDGNGNRVFTSGAGTYPYIAFHVAIGQTLRINSIHLEYGNVGTRRIPRNGTEDMLLCQRHALVYPNDSTFAGTINAAGNLAYINIPTPVMMRVLPTVSTTTVFNVRANGVLTRGTLSAVELLSPTQVRLKLTLAASLQGNSPAACYTSGGAMILSADLVAG